MKSGWVPKQETTRNRWQASTSVRGLLIVLVLSLPSAAQGFALFPLDSLSSASRWATPEIDNDIQVGVEPGFATQLGAANASEIAIVEQAVLDAFAMWQSNVLQFDVAISAAGVVEGELLGLEIDVFAVPGTHPAFASLPTGFGITFLSDSFNAGRVLTNGQNVAGYEIQGVDIYVNITNVSLFAAVFQPTLQEQADALTRLLGHEIGHAIGLGHPNSNDPFGVKTNYDTDLFPNSLMIIDPVNPLSGVMVSPNRDDEAIMSNRPCGEPFLAPCAAVYYTTYQFDDRGGRDFLYPDLGVQYPEVPALAPLGSLALALSVVGVGVWTHRRHRRPARPVSFRES